MNPTSCEMHRRKVEALHLWSTDPLAWSFRMTENRFSPCYEFKLAGSEATGTFAGYASTFGGIPDSYGDIIAPGAFLASLAEHRQKGSLPAMLWAHQPDEPIGRWITLKEDSHGLAVEGKLTIGTKRGAEAYALMNDGALGLSVGFRVQPDGARYQGSTRILKGVDLLEISPVAMPANSFARVTGVKSALSKPVNIREFEAALRDACGLSVREAKRVASAGWPALQHRDDASDELTTIAAHFSLAALEIQLNQ